MKIQRLITLGLLLLGINSLLADSQRYTVSAGDTVYSIARRFNIDAEELIDQNSIADPTKLQIGQTLHIGEAYRVKPGDTLYSIAAIHGVPLDQLCDLNEISPETILKVDMLLQIPGDSSEVQTIAEQDVEERLDQEGDESFVPQENKGSEEAPGEDSSWPHRGPRSVLNGKLRGVEIMGTQGDEVVSVNTGNVVWVAPYRGYGRLVMVEGPEDMIYAYGGNEETYVRVGDRIHAGTVIGKLGVHPVEKEAKVYFFVYKDGKALDPVKVPRG